MANSFLLLNSSAIFERLIFGEN